LRRPYNCVMFRAMRIESLIASLAVCVSVTGCEHKSPHDDQGQPNGKNPWTDNAGSAGSAAAGMGKPMTPPPTPPPVDKGPPAPAPTGDVRAPTAADLADYTKDIKGSGPLTATIETTLGTFHCELFPDQAPMTVANFVGLATGKKAWSNPKTGNVEKGKPFYDGLIFHRVIPKFMVQGGDATGTGTGDPGYKFDDEIAPELSMKEGTLAMANAGSRGGHGTNGSQFFITEIAPTWLNGKHTIFGQCKEVDLVKKITSVDKGPGDRPKVDIVMTKVTISK
jgi:peptidyl-prolyl cis-trans isomerase A (cyclophilin A)